MCVCVCVCVCVYVCVCVFVCLISLTSVHPKVILDMDGVVILIGFECEYGGYEITRACARV